MTELLQGVLEDGQLSDREALARHGLAYVRSFIAATSHRWRFGFECAADVPDDVAHACVAELLREVPGTDGMAPTVPLLRRGLLAVLRPAPPENGAGDRWLLAYHRLLRFRAWQCLQRVWRERHPAQARLLRRLKQRLRRSTELRIVWDSRGQFACSRSSDLRRPPLAREELERRLVDPRFLLDLCDSERVLGETLAESGHCYLMDLVRAIQSGREVLLAGMGECWCDDTVLHGAAPGADAPPDLARLRWLPMLRVRVRDIAARQAEKAGRRARRSTSAASDPVLFDDRLIEGRVDVAVEMVARKLGLGRPDWEGRSQRELLTGLLPPATCPHTVRRVQIQTDYLVRCILSELRSRSHS